ncbi:terminase [Arthrobacter phage vB_ArS-ArV2]|uniref:Terminase n=1 Tax=Arthrobacter phage vB_ArS-ArV2 TaxID=1414742 RepID=V5R8Y1_9CAUD|nr:terminase [Arthrobacter phage vB_ArS-ArV2]AHB31613.1 terminase [Arthrobacter phage vB_ArS-ArV2]
MTRSSTPTLFESARHVIVPEGIVSTGWPAVRDTLGKLGITFDSWQQGASQLILSKDENGLYATTVGGVTISIPRQVGKTFMIGWIVFALCIIYPGLTVVWTAHRASTADETFDGMKSMAASPTMAPHIDRTPDNGSEQKIEFKNGSRVVFGARERGFGRGFTKLDIVVFDEAQILTERSIDDMIPAQNASGNALTIMIGTPPKPIDPSEVFEDARRAALAGEAPDALYIEFSADRKADPDDRAQWRKANPSYPSRTKEAAMLRMRRKLSPDSFLREAMGIWDEMASRKTAFPPGAWEACAIEDPSEEWPIAAIGIDMNPERTWVTVSLAMFSDDGLHLEVAETESFNETGSAELVAWIHKLARRRIPVVIDAFSPARTFEPALKEKKCMVRILSSSEFSQACMGLHDAVREGTVSHFGQQQLDDSVSGATKKPVGKAGAWAFARDDLDVDLTQIMSITCAHFGAVKFARKPAVSESGEGGVTVC